MGFRCPSPLPVDVQSSYRSSPCVDEKCSGAGRQNSPVGALESELWADGEVTEIPKRPVADKAPVDTQQDDSSIDVQQLKDIMRYAFERIDANSDGKITIDEVMLACRLMSLDVSDDIVLKSFYELSAGREYILPEDMTENLHQNLLEKLDARVSSWYESGLGKGAYIVNGFMEALQDEKLPMPQRVQRGMETLPNQGLLMTEFLEFVIPSALLLDKLACVPNCADIDATDIVPLLALLWRSMSEMAGHVKDHTTFDLDQTSAMVFAIAFKPAGFTVASFQQLMQHSDARWVIIPKGTRVDMKNFGDSVAVVGRGQLRIQEDSVAPRLSETNVELGPGAFIGTSASLTSVGDVARRSPWLGRGRYIVADEEVAMLEFKAEALRRVLDVDAELRAKFQSAFVKSTIKTMSLTCAQSKKIALELPSLFRDVLVQMKEHFNADRASVWIHDHQQKRLWTLFVKEDGSTSYYSMPDTAGLAGHAYLHGEVVSIPDCYMDARFNIEADRSTGYRTKSMLCVPIRGERGVEGVIQLINKLAAPQDVELGAAPSFVPFDATDEAKADECMWQIILVVKQLRERYHPVD